LPVLCRNVFPKDDCNRLVKHPVLHETVTKKTAFASE
jgi:hypothetical protein